MDDFRSISIFDDLLEDESDADIVEIYREFALVQDPEQNSDKTFTYKIYDEFGVLVKTLKASIDAQNVELSVYNNSNIRRVFVSYVNSQHMSKALERNKARNKNKPQINRNKYPSHYSYEDDDDTFYGGYDANTGASRSFANYSYKPYFYDQKPKSTGFLDKLNKSDTLVIHCQDSSTDMLAQVYQGRGWDVLRDGNIDKSELHELIKSHDKIICLGHGTPSGLINKQGGGYVIGDTEAPFLKDKNIFAIWCNADKYFAHHNIGKGCFITKNVPSEVWEASAVGYHVTGPWMLENITYWSKCCADVVDQALNGDVKGAVEKARAAYQERYGNDTNPDQKGVTDYNTDAIQVQP